MKFRPVTKLDKRHTATSKQFDDDVMLANCDVIVGFPVYDQLGATRKPNYECMVCKICIFINNLLLSCKNCKRN